MSICALGNMFRVESECKVRDTSHNAISIDEVGYELFLLSKGLYFPPNYLCIFSNNPPKSQLLKPPNLIK